MGLRLGIEVPRVKYSLLHSSNRPIHSAFVSLEVTPYHSIRRSCIRGFTWLYDDEPETLPLLLTVTHKIWILFVPFLSLEIYSTGTSFPAVIPKLPSWLSIGFANVCNIMTIGIFSIESVYSKI